MDEHIKRFFWSKRELLTSATLLVITNSFQLRNLSERQKAIILGNILGDGHLQLSDNKKTVRLRYSHQLAQKEYVDWQYKNLGFLTENVKNPYIEDPKKPNPQYIGYTSRVEELLPYHNQFYLPTGKEKPKYRKTITNSIISMMQNPEILMVWFLDDGTKRDYDACRIATHSFSNQENEILREALWQNFRVSSKIEITKRIIPVTNEVKTYYSLSIPAKQGAAKKFIHLFKNSVLKEVPSMSYKVDI